MLQTTLKSLLNALIQWLSWAWSIKFQKPTSELWIRLTASSVLADSSQNGPMFFTWFQHFKYFFWFHHDAQHIINTSMLQLQVTECWKNASNPRNIWDEFSHLSKCYCSYVHLFLLPQGSEKLPEIYFMLVAWTTWLLKYFSISTAYWLASSIYRETYFSRYRMIDKFPAIY